MAGSRRPGRDARRLRVVTVVQSVPQVIAAVGLWPAFRLDHIPRLFHAGSPGYTSRKLFADLDPWMPNGWLRLSHTCPPAQVSRRLEGLIAEELPNVWLAIGDGSHELAAARAAAAQGVAVARLGAGRRSRPGSPEAAVQVELDRMSNLRFCSRQAHVDRLGREGITDCVHLVGDIEMDAALAIRRSGQKRSGALTRFRVEPGRFLLMTVRGTKLKQPERLNQLLRLLAELPGRVIFCTDDRGASRRYIADLLEREKAISGVQFVPELSPLDLIWLAANASHVLTDSWSLTRSAYAMHTPILTLLNRTACADTLSGPGCNTIVDLDPGAVAQALAAPRPTGWPDVYGGGRASERISRVLTNWRPWR